MGTFGNTWGSGFGGGKSLRDVLVTVPVGFTYVPPFNIYKNNGVYFIDPSFNLQTYANITVAKTYYVDKSTGNDGNTGADWDHAIKTLKVAMEKADVDRIYIRNSYFYFTERLAGPTRSMEIIGVGDNVMITSDLGNIQSAWGAVDNHYECTVTGYSYVASSTDSSNIDVDGYPTRLTRVTSIEEVDATPNSFWESASAPTRTVYLKTFDSRVPDTDIILYESSTIYKNVDNVTLYMENLYVKSIYMGNSSAVGNSKLYLKNVTTEQISELGLNEVIFQNVVSKNAVEDGMNYADKNGVLTNVIEINCESYDCGVSSTDQASTGHNGLKLLRINGKYHNSTGACISESTAAETWMLGSELYNSTTAKTGFYSSIKAWLDGVYIHDCDSYDIVNLEGAITYIRNCTLEKGVNNIGGTLTTY